MKQASRQQRVIGFKREMKCVNDWLSDAQAQTTIISVSGIGGIGKTTLMVEMAKSARLSSMRVLWLDGVVGLTSPGAFLAGLEMNLEIEYGRKRRQESTLLSYIVSELFRERTVLFIDNGEPMDRLEGWLLSSFLPEIQSACVLIVCASRKGLSLKWQRNPYWNSSIHTFPLQLFSRAEVYDYLKNTGFSAEQKKAIAEKTEGHPLALALAVDLLLSDPGEERNVWRELPSILSAEFLREAAAPSIYRALTVLSLLPVADEGMLNALLDKPLEEKDYHKLAALSFVQVTMHGVSLHHVVAKLLRDEFARKNPRQFEMVRSKVFNLLAERFHLVDREMQMRLAAQALELYREFLPSSHAYASFSSALRAGKRRPFRQEDLASLHRLLAVSLDKANWQSELVEAADYRALLKDIALHAPEGLFIVRDDRGTPLAFSAGIWLHAESMPLLERYVPRYRDLLGDESAVMSRLPKEMSDTIVVLLSAVDAERPLYRPEELGALLMQQWLIDMAGGLRGILASGDPQLNTLLCILGFTELGKIAIHGGAELTQWELDFRQATFDKWVHRIIGQTESQAAQLPVPCADEPGLTIERNEMKNILACLYEPDMLAKLPVFRRLKRNPQLTKEMILEMLSDTKQTDPLTSFEKELLVECYVRKQKNKNQLAAFYHMSRSTFYRYTRLAEKHLAAALCEKINSMS